MRIWMTPSRWKPMDSALAWARRRFLTNPRKLLPSQMSRRLRGNIFVIFLAWPLITVISASIQAKNNLYFSLSWKQSIISSLAGMVLLMPDFLFIALFLVLLSISIFSFLSEASMLAARAQPSPFEPCLLFLAILFGTTFYYPSVLNHPLLLAFPRSCPVWLFILILLLLLLAGSFYLASSGARIKCFTILSLTGFLCPLPVLFDNATGPNASCRPSLVLLGLDSLSYEDDFSTLKKWAEQNNGTWYRHVVTPGLITNSVWTSVLTMQPVGAHRVCSIFQRRVRLGHSDNLIARARKAGYYTIGVFPDQTTITFGADTDFDEDRSGPLGWRQVVTANIENSSFFLPLFRPLLGKLPFSSVPANHQGTFTYSIDKELGCIFTLGSKATPAFVAAHTTYLHAACFPSIVELSWPEYSRVVRAKLSAICDRSFFWQDHDLPTDAIKLHEWKKRRLQQAVIEAVKKSGFIDRGGQLLLFSDHGGRAGLTANNFGQDKYCHVFMATFGLPSGDPDVPLSLIDAGALLGFAPDLPPSKPVVEFTMAEPAEWRLLAKTARLEWNGAVVFDETLLSGILLKRLQKYQPDWANK